MFNRRRRGIGIREIFLATIIGVAATLYTWTPILREQKSKQLQLSENLQQQSGESQQNSNETQTKINDQNQKT